MDSDGFCEPHRIGFVGGRGYVTQLTYRLARGEPVQQTAEYARLRAAIERLDSCEHCALATFTNGRCPTCNIYYRDSQQIPPPTKKASR